MANWGEVLTAVLRCLLQSAQNGVETVRGTSDSARLLGVRNPVHGNLPESQILPSLQARRRSSSTKGPVLPKEKQAGHFTVWVSGAITAQKRGAALAVEQHCKFIASGYSGRCAPGGVATQEVSSGFPGHGMANSKQFLL